MSEQGALSAAALYYAGLGYRVFPCVPGQKNPLTKRGFHDATVDPEQVEKWWTEHPQANIGLPTDGLLVLDIDGPGNPWPGDPDRAADLAGAGAVALTPRGGRHYLFRCPDGKHWRCSAGRLAPGVDVRATGGYIVVAPSATADGVYKWAPGLSLDRPRDSLPSPPVWLIEMLDQLAQTGNEPHQLAPSGMGSHQLAPTGTGSHRPEEEPIREGQRNDVLCRLAGTMRRAGMGRAAISAALHQHNRERCLPPLPDREVEGIAASVSRYRPDEVTVAFIEEHFIKFWRTGGPETDGPDDDINDPGAVPDELLYVPGFINDVMQYTLDTAPYPEPVLAFAGALALQALLAGRKVRDAMDNRTNLYVLSLANSGAGKDHARKVNARILYEAGLADCLGTSFASGEGIEDRLYTQPATLFQVDEIDGLLLRVGQARDARHEAIVSMLLQMYTASNNIYVMRAKAKQERAVIDQPCLCLFGTAVPKHFYESLTARLLTNGFLARLLILECRGRGSGRDCADRPVPAGIVETARWWAEFRPETAGDLYDQHPVPHCVPTTPEAETVFRSTRSQADAEYTKCEQANDPGGMAIWARAYEKARRLAMIYACSENHKNPIITASAATWASALATHTTHKMIYTSRQHTSENEFDAKRKRLLEFLNQWERQYGEGDWVPFWRISRKLPWPRREHEEIRDTLLQQRLIEYKVLSTGGRGRPGAYYRLAKPGGPGPAEQTTNPPGANDK